MSAPRGAAARTPSRGRDWTDAERATLRALWGKEAPEAIARRLGRTVRGVERQVVLGRAAGESRQGVRWSAAEERRAWEMHAQGRGVGAIAEALGRSVLGVKEKLRALDGPPRVKVARRCMCCGAGFESDVYRLCADCRRADVSPFAP